MPAKSEAQRRLFAAALAAKRGDKNVGGQAKEIAKTVSEEDIRDFAKKPVENKKDKKDKKEESKKTASYRFNELRKKHNLKKLANACRVKLAGFYKKADYDPHEYDDLLSYTVSPSRKQEIEAAWRDAIAKQEARRKADEASFLSQANADALDTQNAIDDYNKELLRKQREEKIIAELNKPTKPIWKGLEATSYRTTPANIVAAAIAEDKERNGPLMPNEQKRYAPAPVVAPTPPYAAQETNALLKWLKNNKQYLGAGGGAIAGYGLGRLLGLGGFGSTLLSGLGGVGSYLALDPKARESIANWWNQQTTKTSAECCDKSNKKVKMVETGDKGISVKQKTANALNLKQYATHKLAKVLSKRK